MECLLRRTLALAPLALALGLAAAAAAEPELYFYAQGDLHSADFLANLTSWMGLARTCGYGGVFYADAGIQTMHVPGAVNATFLAHLQAFRRSAEALGLKVHPLIFPFGPSVPIFQQPPWGHTLAEPLAFRGALFEVTPDGRALSHVEEFGGIANGEFSERSGDHLAHWVQDAPGRRTFAAASGCRSAGGCLRVGPGRGDGLVMQPLAAVRPFTQLHVSFSARTSNFRAVQYNVEVRALLSAPVNATGVRPHLGRRLSWWPLELAPTQPWQSFDFLASSWDGVPVALFIGQESRGDEQEGDIWFDDVSVRTSALINTIRREGAPLRVYDTMGEDLEEGRDIEPVADPLTFRDGSFDNFHAAPVVRVPASGSRLQPGQQVRIDYYAVNPVFISGVASCLLHEGVFQYMRESAMAVASNADWEGFLMSYDEIRQLHNDAQETSQFATAGNLLAWHVHNATRTVRAAAPAAKLYVWDDMFNPFHNAGAEDDYFLANGSLSGSWEGLDPNEVSMLTWGPCNESEPVTPGLPTCRFRSGLDFFARRGIHQILGGYYDYSPCEGCPRSGAAAAEREHAFARGVPLVDGYMYTTWGSNNPDGQPNYEQMCDYAHTLRWLHAQDSMGVDSAIHE